MSKRTVKQEQGKATVFYTMHCNNNDIVFNAWCEFVELYNRETKKDNSILFNGVSFQRFNSVVCGIGSNCQWLQNTEFNSINVSILINGIEQIEEFKNTIFYAMLCNEFKGDIMKQEQKKISNVETETTENDTINTVVENEIQSVENTESGDNMNEQKTTGTEQEQEIDVYSICKKIMDNQSVTIFTGDKRQNDFNYKTEKEQGKISVIAKKYDTHEFKVVELIRKFDIEKQLSDREQYFYNVVMMLMNSSNNDGHIFSLSSIAKFMFNNQILSKKQQEKKTELLLQGKTVNNEFFYINKKSVTDLNLINKIVGIIALRGIYSYEPLQDKNGCYLFKRVAKNTYYSLKKQEQKQEQKSDIEKMLSMVASDEFGISVNCNDIYSLIKELMTVYNDNSTENKISIALLNK